VTNKIVTRSFLEARHAAEWWRFSFEGGEAKDAIAGQDIVYVNLADDLEAMAKNIVKQ
jgi:hypothetical protein